MKKTVFIMLLAIVLSVNIKNHKTKNKKSLDKPN